MVSREESEEDIEPEEDPVSCDVTEERDEGAPRGQCGVSLERSHIHGVSKTDPREPDDEEDGICSLKEGEGPEDHRKPHHCDEQGVELVARAEHHEDARCIDE